MIVIGLPLLLLCPANFSRVNKKTRAFVPAMALVTRADSQEGVDSDGDSVTHYYNVLSIRNQSGRELSTVTVWGRRKVDQHYLVLYDPATRPKEKKNLMNLSLSSTWFWLFLSLVVSLFFLALIVGRASVNRLIARKEAEWAGMRPGASWLRG
jgi:hypothetical protein